ncbi:uncharacterized protein LOC124625784 [Schistocerca americana]|uniref:uncharacterized protein LOC124625784 n=1 Tax=Schistocerca americana TaxID=7009 RepID=UPI001F4FDF5D|nr:uncharacterized protein LOC124625784 [Schistocerca americana]XP_049941282.1 uncharacterized protein LOC126418523 [Schistocerca serialis cubense]XP_049941283.1 uncharacterized protein LOC126418523 [Schistocerca serialis cubense]
MAPSTAALAVVALLALSASASDSHPSHRWKRLSDQRLAELETLVALEAMGHTVPVGAGVVDPRAVGRKRSDWDDTWRPQGEADVPLALYGGTQGVWPAQQ